MRGITIVISLCALALTGPTMTAADFDHLYTPYGFKLPLLHRGDYILTLDYSGAKSTSEIRYSAESEASKSETHSNAFQLQGVLALSDKLQLQGSLHITPQYSKGKDEVTEFITVGGGFHTETSPLDIQEQARISPSVLLVYRPIQCVEVFGSVGYHTNESKNVAAESKEEYPYNNKYSTTSYSVGIALTGHL